MRLDLLRPSSSSRRDAARARQTQARRDLTTHARSLAFGDLADGGDTDSNGPPGERLEDGNVRRAVSGPGLDSAASPSAAYCELGAAADAADPDAETLDAGARASAAMDADACEPEPSGDTPEGSKPPKFAARRRSSSAPGEWSRADHAGRGPGPGGRSSFGDTQFMRPEWLVDIPNDLARAWCVLPRPEGRRALVVASRGSTAARAKTGGISRRFASALPGGSRRTKHGKAEGDFCILDCVFHEADATYYVLDTLAWNGVSLYDCAAEMRAAWTHAKLGDPETAECPEAGAVNDGGGVDGAPMNAFRFSPLPVYDADATGIRNAYETVPVPFQRDGLLFLAKDGAYELGVTPLAALWKDARCSRHFLEENPGKPDPERQRLVLSLNARTGDVVTGDAAPIALARLPAEYVAPEDGGAAPPGGGLRAGALVKFALGDGGIVFSEDGGVLGADLVYEGLANQRRGHGADTMTKVLFQYNARRNPITVEELCAAAEEQTRAGDALAANARRAELFDSLP